MKHTEEQMMSKVKQVLSDLQGSFFKEENLKKIVFEPNRVPRIADNEGKITPCWIAVIDDPIFDTSVFLTISDETGEPLYIQNKHSVEEIAKNSDGKYYGVKS